MRWAALPLRYLLTDTHPGKALGPPHCLSRHRIMYTWHCPHDMLRIGVLWRPAKDGEIICAMLPGCLGGASCSLARGTSSVLLV